MAEEEVKKLAGAVLLLLLSACHPWIFHPVDPEYRGWDNRPKTRVTRAFLGQNNQICLEWKKEHAPVDIFVIPKHPGVVKLVINEEHIYRLAGDSVHLTLNKVGPGQWKADIYLDEEYQLTVSWSIWDCGPKEELDKNLYRPTREGSPGGLKGYCPECECTTPE